MAHFLLHVCLCDDDYLAFNRFWLIHSPYGKKQTAGERILIALIGLAFCAFCLVSDGFSPEGWLGILPIAIVLFAIELFFNTFLSWSIKGTVKAQKKKGKLAYSPTADVAFYDEHLVESTPDGKTEIKYTAIERVSVVADSVIYIHFSTVGALILPLCAFASNDERRAFVAFISEKCACVDLYARRRK